MHILYLSVPDGGLDTNVRVLAPVLVQAGHHVSVLYIHFPNEICPASSAIDGYRIYHASMGSWHYYAHRATFGIGSISLVVRSLEYARSLARAVADIHSREPIDLIELPEIFIRPGWVGDIPYVMRLHSSAWMCRRMYGEESVWTDAVEADLEGLALRSAVGISSPSRAVAEYIRLACRLGERQIASIPYPIDTTLFVPGTARANPPIILFVGRIEMRKGADVLLQAMPRVWERHPDCQLVLAGRVSEELGDLVTRSDSRVRFLGALPRGELVQWYQAAALFVAPSLWDNSPNTVYEAMACGTPVIATRVGGIPELVEQGATGLLVPPRDSDALADALIVLLSDSKRRERMGRCGREKASDEFGAGRIATQTVEFYNRIMPTGATP